MEVTQKKMTAGYFIKTAIYSTVGWFALALILTVVFFPIGLIMLIATPIVPFVAPFKQLEKENKKLIKQHKEDMVMRFLSQQSASKRVK